MSRTSDVSRVTRAGSVRRLSPYFKGVFLTLLLAACGQSNGCGGCEQEGPPFPDKDRVHSAVQVRVTEGGLNFLEQNLEPLLAEALPDGLDICLPGQGGQFDVLGLNLVEWGFCQAECDGAQGCGISIAIDSVDLQAVAVPDAADRLRALVVFQELNADIDLDIDVFGADLLACRVELRGGGFPVQVDLALSTPDPTRDLTFSVEDPTYRIADLGISMTGEGTGLLDGACDIISGVLDLPFLGDFILDLLQGFIEGPLNDVISGFVDDFTCRTCEVDNDCPLEGGAVCDGGRCILDGACIPAALGIEGTLDIGGLLSGFSPGLEAEVDYLATPGSYVEVEQNGLSVGMIAGAVSLRDRCVPLRPQPEIIEPARAEILRGNVNPAGDAFEMGVGISQEIMGHVLWAAFNSGALCLVVTNDAIDQLSVGTLGLLIRSLRDLAPNDAPVAITLAPQEVPIVTFGGNVVVDGEDEGERILQDPLATVGLPNLWIDFHVFIEGRWVRVFSLSADVELPLAVDFTPENQIIPVLGDVAAGIMNIQAHNAEIIAPGDAARVAGLIPTLLGPLLPSLLGSLSDPIELPELMGFRLDLQDGSLQGIEDNTFLGVFANLERAEEMPEGGGPATPRVNTFAELLELHVPDTAEFELDGLETWKKPYLRVALSATDGTTDEAAMEYSWRVDGSSWSLFSHTDFAVIRDPALLWQGRHTLQVRARRVDDYRTLDPTPAVIEFIVDSVEPALALEKVAGHVTVDVSDMVSPLDAIAVEWMDETGAWRVLDGDSLALETVRALGVLTVRATDEAGNTATASIDVAEAELIGRPSREDRLAPEDGGGCDGCGGCAVHDRHTPAWPSGLALMLPLLALGFRRRGAAERRLMWILMTVSMLALTVGCSDDSKGGGDDEIMDGGAGGDGGDGPTNECETDDDCEEPNEACQTVDGRKVCTVIPCEDDGICERLDCPDGRNAACGNNGVCQCEAFCADGCGDGEYCCVATNACEPVPEACADTECGPGTELMVTNAGEVDPMACVLEGVQCDCVELEPLEAGVVGKHSDMATVAGAAWISAYAEDWGDLVVARWGASEEAPTWWWVDGLGEGDVVGAPSGPRGGVEEEGDDVGLYTSIAIDDMGRIHVAYQDVTNQALKYALGVPEGEEIVTWSTVTVDDQGGQVGQWASITVDARGVPGIAYRAAGLPGEGGMLSQVRYALARNDAPTDAGDWSDPLVIASRVYVPEEASGGYPEGTGLFTSQTRDRDGLPVVAWYDRTEGQLWWSRFAMAGFGEPELLAGHGHPLRDGDMGTNVDIAAGPDGTFHLCYQDGSTDSLRYLTPGVQCPEAEPCAEGDAECVDECDEWVDTGVRFNAGREYALHVVGEDCNMAIADDGAPFIVYQDATMQDILLASRNPEAGGRNDDDPKWGWTTLRGAERDFEGSFGFYTAAALEGMTLWVTSYFIDNQSADATSGLDLFTRPLE
jgi:hypothetical protein